MKTTPHKTERLHSMDALRAIMMLLGLVIHSAITYAVTDWGNVWSLKDPNATHWTNDYIVDFIHAFRMQIFFFVAGFFGAMLFYERQPLRMVKNRVQRIVFPFLVFVFLLWPSIIFSFVYTRLSFAGDPQAMETALSFFSTSEGYIPGSTFHLWFLYYLALITGFTVLLALITKRFRKFGSNLTQMFNTLIKQPVLRILVLAIFTAMVYLFMNTSQVATSGSFIPDVNTFTYYAFFYIIGWVLFKSKHLLDRMMKLDFISTGIGVALFTGYFFWHESFNLWGAIAIKSVMVWCLIFGVTGLFIRYASNHSPIMRYISDASYWVYLIHLSFTAILPVLIKDWALPATIKFLIVMCTTFFICFLTYHLFVRSSVIGQFLNGRRYTRKLKDIKPSTTSKVTMAVDK
ncbi:acyltransferase family protein [Winogradskyella aurantia]|uniref:2,3,4,5-tetrahydropyridine-2,6-carboxylate N-succinyltransferase n=1 Tax=Winogradskyella aurantia TaxID=1915063 RepID=A0A265UXH7_9FLAO|nr:acyltransferase family protein [Winogradskyella aurantia]OZV70014.1 2,3,4,5-tetrahydropyridine-2,6-carboxylate N-succinyltransferase [Winogradskyella aurantia]